MLALPKLALFIFLSILSSSLAATTALAEVLPLHAFVSIAPQRILVQRLAGPSAQVDVLVQPGQDPHTYEPTARLIARLAQAEVYIRIGVPFENAWMSRLRAVNPRMEVLDLSAGLDLSLPKAVSSTPMPTAQTNLDPHLWTSPPLVRRMGLRLRDYLVQRDPNHAAAYRANYLTFSADLDALEQDIRTTLATSSKPCRFMVFHPAWGYFAAAYGLIQIPIENNGKAPGSKTLAGLIAQAKQWGLRVIFVQPQFDRKTAQTLVTAINGHLEVLDPLVEDYFTNLRQAAHQIARSCNQ